jgi:glycosyltransferase involved in cell wall biosynthesis
MHCISVIVPSYNQSSYLPICLDSIWFQDWPEIEIIVVNDASTDATCDILNKYENSLFSDKVSYAFNYDQQLKIVERCEHLRYPSIGRKLRIIHHSENKGLGSALNTGFKAATGEYCTFIASDDMLLPSALSELASGLEQNNADFAYADMHIMDDTGRILRKFSLPDYDFKETFCRWYFCGICKLYRRELHARIGYYDEKIKPQDHEMFLRFALNGARFTHIPKVLANVRIHDNDREIDNHTPENWNKLYKESSALVMMARKHLEKND